MHEKEPVLSLNGEVIFSSGYSMNGYSSKPADNDGSGSESGYTTPKKRRARRSSMRSTESLEKEKAAKPCSKHDMEMSSLEMSGKTLHQTRPNCTRTYLKPEVHTGARRSGIQDVSPVADVQHRNSESKASVGLVGKKTDDKINKGKPVSSVGSKEDSWTLFKPPPVFPVDNSSAKIVPKISYASKVKENLNKAAQASAEMAQMSAKPSHVPMSAVKTVTSASFANIAPSLGANGCHSVEMLLSSAAKAPFPSNHAEEESVESDSDKARSSLSCLSAPEPRKSSLFVYPHKPLNMQPPAAQTNQKALGNIFQNQWGLSFINEPNAGPVGAPVSRTAAPFQISEITFQGGNVPFLIQPSLNAVSLPAPQDVHRGTNGTNVTLKLCSTSHTASHDCLQAQPDHQEEPKVECRSSDASYEDLDAKSMRNCEGLLKGPAVNKQDGLHGWGYADLQAAVFYHSKGTIYLNMPSTVVKTESV